MSVFLIDPLYPSRLRCERCGATVAALPDDGEAPEGELTAGQVAHLWPQLARGVAAHDASCPARHPLFPAANALRSRRSQLQLSE